MTDKAIGIIIVIVILLGIGGYAYSNWQKSNSTIELNGDVQGQPLIGDPSPTSGLSQNSLKEVNQTNTMKNNQTKPKMFNSFPGVLPDDQLQNKKIVITMAKGGTIEFEIFPDAPKAASNFIFLTKQGFYDGLTFHRVVPGFVIQGGDPLGNGTGGPGYKFEDEPVTRKYDKGIVAMANAGPNTNGSQFFIMLDDNPQLPPNYTIFGKVISGQDVVDNVKVGDVMQKVTVEDYTPQTNQQ